jgi:hypothetical protein
VVVAVVLLVLAAGGVWFAVDYFERSRLLFFTRDAVQVIALESSSVLFEDDPECPRDKVDELIKQLHEASVINLRIDATGKAVDPYGTAFRVEHEVEDGSATTTVTSAGPDRRFGTRDDIQYSYTDKTGV